MTTACSFKSDSRDKQSEKTDTLQTADNMTVDTLRIYKIKYDTSYSYIFPAILRAAYLSQDDIKICETLLNQYIADYNKEAKLKYEEVTKKYPNQGFNLLDFTIELQEYGRQYMAVTGDNGEKLVYVNCFCDPTGFDYRETELVRVMDGGNCFFNFKVNLTTKRLYDFMENGVA